VNSDDYDMLLKSIMCQLYLNIVVKFSSLANEDNTSIVTLKKIVYDYIDRRGKILEEETKYSV
jgi:hypothetical protein